MNGTEGRVDGIGGAGGMQALGGGPPDPGLTSNAPPQLNRFGIDRKQKRLWCHWPWSTMVLTCDGTVVCGCGDAFNENPMGRVGAGGLSALDVWRGEGFQRMRRGMRENHPPAFCYKCGLMEVHPAGFEPPDLPLVPDTHPRILYVEPTIVCNLRCPQPACAPEEVYGTRAERLLSFDLFRGVVDEVGPHLERMVFYNYGESFIHPDACEMIAYLKERHPHVWVWTSTNGHYFTSDAKARAVVDCGLNEIQFSIDGATQAVYEQYRKSGKIDKALGSLRRVAEERDRRGSAYPWIIWNYILFRWNDRDEEMEKAKALAIELGVDRLTWTTTDQPLGFPSERFVPGSADYERIRHGLIAGGLPRPNAIRWRATITPISIPLRVPQGGYLVARFRVRNDGDVAWDAALEGRPRCIRLGADVHAEAGGERLRERFMGTALPRSVAPGESVDLELMGCANLEPGRYRLKADLVRELLWRFEELGSTAAEWDLLVEPNLEAQRHATVPHPPTHATASAPLAIDVTVRGPAGALLDGTPAARHRFGVGLRWQRLGTDDGWREGPRIYFDPPLEPGRERDVRFDLPPGSPGPGRWRMKVDLLREGVNWFEDHGFEPAVFDLEVTGRLASFALVQAPDRVRQDEPFELVVDVRNESGAAFPGPGSEATKAGIRWYAAGQGASPVRDEERVALVPPIAPGDTRRLTFQVPASSLPVGRAVARVDLVLEGRYWYETMGLVALAVPVDVVP